MTGTFTASDLAYGLQGTLPGLTAKYLKLRQCRHLTHHDLVSPTLKKPDARLLRSHTYS